MEEVEHQLTNLEYELVDQAAENTDVRRSLPPPSTDLLTWLATHFFAGFVTMAAASSLVFWMVAYRADLLCAEREEDDERSRRDAKRRGTKVASDDGGGGTSSMMAGEHNSTTTTTTTTTTRRRKRGKNEKKKERERTERNRHKEDATERRTGSLRVKGESTTRTLLHNHRIERCVECLQELLAEAGEWGTTVNSHGQLLITCRGQILSMERTLEMASYTQDSEEDNESEAA
jgi:hypothetical protein